MFLNGRFLGQRVTGVQRFAREVIRAGTEQELWRADTTLLTPREAANPQSFCGIPVQHVGRSKGHLWEQLELPRAAGATPLINLCNTAPILRRRQLVVLHDAAIAAMPQGFTPAFRLWYRAMIRGYGRLAYRITSVSKFSAAEITRYFGVPADRIEIIPESGEHILREQTDYRIHEKHRLEPDSYFLAAGSLAAHKNFGRVLQAVSRLPPLKQKFVIVGGRNAKVFNSKNIDISGAIEVGYVSDAQLRALYERAACFVYPSLYEGFGLPPLEAMTCGCPVLVARAASLPEICGDAAAYCDPYDPADIARQLLRLLESGQARDELRISGRKRAEEWTWSKAAHVLHDIIACTF